MTVVGKQQAKSSNQWEAGAPYLLINKKQRKNDEGHVVNTIKVAVFREGFGF
jgi:hypothetical protein